MRFGLICNANLIYSRHHSKLRLSLRWCHAPAGVRRVVIVRAGLRRADVAARSRASTARSYAFSPRSRGAPPGEPGAFWRACMRCGRSRRACWRDWRWLSARNSTGGDMPRIESIAKRSSPPAGPIARSTAIGSTRKGATSGARMPPCAHATAPRAWAGIMASAARSTGGCSRSRTASAPSASCHPGARYASIIATRRDRCAGSCATSATPRSGCSATIASACGRRPPMSIARAALNAQRK